MTTRLRGITLAASLGALLMPAGARAQDTLESLHQQAIASAQTELMIYLPAVRAFQPLLDAFTASYPEITIATSELSGPALFARLEAERATRTPTADLVLTGELDFPVLAEDGWLEAYAPPGIEALAPEYVGTANQWLVWSLGLVGPVVNTTVISGEGTHSWSELTDAAFAGQMVINNPMTPGTSTLSLATLYEAGVIDDAWVGGFASRAPATAASTSAMLQSVATGQYPVVPFMPYALFRVIAAQGAPVAFWAMAEGYPTMPLSAGIVENAPHPAAARLFMAWLISDESAALQPRLGQVSTVAGAPGIEGFDGTLIALTGQRLVEALAVWSEQARQLAN